jgi:hypothetical protein
MWTKSVDYGSMAGALVDRSVKYATDESGDLVLAPHTGPHGRRSRTMTESVASPSVLKRVMIRRLKGGKARLLP